jgi:hypothetical protein
MARQMQLVPHPEARHVIRPSHCWHWLIAAMFGLLGVAGGTAVTAAITPPSFRDFDDRLLAAASCVGDSWRRPKRRGVP